MLHVVARHSEGVEGVGALAASVNDATGATRAALVGVRAQMGASPARLREIRAAVDAAARGLSQLLAGA
jgi:DNA-binding IclR family transcriptional regulator